LQLKKHENFINIKNMELEGAVLYFPILEYLFKNGLSVRVDISHLFKDIHPERMSLTDAANFRVENFFHFLDHMVKNNHIVYDKPTLDRYALAVNGKHNWDIKIPIMASITIDGLLFYYKKRQIDEMIESNGLVKTNISLTKRNIYLTLLIVFLTFCVDAYTIIKNSNDNDSKQQIQRLTNQLQQQNIELVKRETLLNQKSFHMDLSH
jgi:hypothetical protein